jgi:serine/threonine protein phosphatase PrpC
VAEAVVQCLLEIPACSNLAALCAQLDALHCKLHRHFELPGDAAESSPGTTLTLLELPPTGPALLYHVGDSRLFQITADQVIPMTIDHVPATGHLLRQHIDEADWRHHVYERDGSEVSQAFVLGSNLLDPATLKPELTPLSTAELPPSFVGLEDRRAIEVHDGALFVLASDGLWASHASGPWLASWSKVFGKPGRALGALVDDLFTEFILNPPAGLRDDNCTVIALKATHRD